MLVSGTAPIWPDGSVMPDEYLQTKRCFEIIGAALTELGAQMSQVVRTRIYITNVDWVNGVSRAHAEVMGDTRPVATMVVVKGLINEQWRVEIEAEAVIS